MQLDKLLAVVNVPDDVDFADLKLGRDPDGGVTFDWGPIKRVCEASNINPAIFRDTHEDNVSGLIVAWYSAHRAEGGSPDLVAEDLIAEVRAEDASGQRFSLEPGRA